MSEDRQRFGKVCAGDDSRLHDSLHDFVEMVLLHSSQCRCAEMSSLTSGLHKPHP